jgi:hypothetical protein
MDKEFSKEQERLFHLLESKNFNQLDSKERDFVLQQMSMESYQLQRTIIAETTSNTFETPKVKPLEIKPVLRKTKVVPLYQALMAVAAVVIFFLIIWPNEVEKTQVVYRKSLPSVITKTVYDTVFVARKSLTSVKYLYDTVYQVISTFSDEVNNYAQEKRLLEVQRSFELPPLTTELYRVKSLSAKEDTMLASFTNRTLQFSDR